jgi:hypothetical protein
VPPLSYAPNDLLATKEIGGSAAQSDFECLTTLLQRGPGLWVMNTDEHLMRMTVNAFRHMANARDKSALVAEYDLREEKPFKRANRISESKDAAAS